jgi:hypothetical protein
VMGDEVNTLQKMLVAATEKRDKAKLSAGGSEGQ